MRSRFCLVLLLITALTLCACTSAATPPYVSAPPRTVSTVPTQTAIPTTQPPQPVYVSPTAVEDYLLPLEEYSWERKAAPEYVMLHFTSAVVSHPEDPFNMTYIRDIFVEYDLSVHYIVERDGTVRCYIPEDRVAWHAGAGRWISDPKYTNNMNHYAIGIEIIAIGSQSDMADYLTEEDYQALGEERKGFTSEQYDALRALITDICSRNNIPMDRRHVIGHSEYNPEKRDPGQLFDWSQILSDQP